MDGSITDAWVHLFLWAERKSAADPSHYFSVKLVIFGPTFADPRPIPELPIEFGRRIAQAEEKWRKQ
jgi:hypothetical protein